MTEYVKPAKEVYIQNNCYYNDKNITSINLKNTPWINNSMYNAFMYASNVQSVTGINNNVTNMAGAFYSCSNLTSICPLPPKLTTLYDTFASCSNLSTAPVIPNSVTTMAYAFQGTNISTAPVIPNSVTNTRYAFYSCRNLTSSPDIDAPLDNASSMFGYCNNLVSCPNVKYVNSAEAMYEDCDKISTPVFPEECTYAHSTFAGCTNIKSLGTKIEINAKSLRNCFRYCSNLTTLGNIHCYQSAAFADMFRSTPSNKTGTIYVYSCNVGLTSFQYMLQNQTGKITIYCPQKYTNGVNTISWDSLVVNSYNINTYNNKNITIANNPNMKVGDNYWYASGLNKTFMYKWVGGATGTLYPTYNGYETIYVNSCFYNTPLETLDCNNVDFPHNSMYGLFYYPGNLKTVTNISNNITNMAFTFQGANKMVTPPQLPEKVIDLTSTFHYCSSITSAPVIPNSVTTISNMFNCCTNIISAPNIPDSVTNMDSAFAGCSNLQVAPEYIGKNVNSMGWAFNRCNNLVTAPNIPDSAEYMYGIFNGCISLETPPPYINNATTLASAFCYCYNLKSAPNILSPRLNSLYYTFFDCQALTGDIYIASPYIVNSRNAFYNTSLPKNLYFPYRFANGTLTNTYQSLYSYNGYYGITSYDSHIYAERDGDWYRYENYIADYIGPNSSEEIPFNSTYNFTLAPKQLGNATTISFNSQYHTLSSVNLWCCFYNCKELESVINIPANTTNLMNTFLNCTNLVSAPHIPNSVTNMLYTFCNCQRLAHAPDIPNSVTNLRSTFYNTRITTLPNIPNSVTSLDTTFAYTNISTVQNIPNSVLYMNATFMQCKDLTSIDAFPTSLRGLTRTFESCKNLTSVPEIPNSVTDMSGAFEWTGLLTPPNIPNSVTNMSATFCGCNDLTVAPTSLPSGLTRVDSIFRHCKLLTDVPAIPALVNFAETAFENCYSLVNIPSFGLNIRSMWAICRNCGSLTSIPVIPATVNYMVASFDNCTSLTGNIFIKASEITSAVYCFNNTSARKNVYIPFKYANNVNTKTYNAFIEAGYTTTGTKNGVYLMNWTPT